MRAAHQDSDASGYKIAIPAGLQQAPPDGSTLRRRLSCLRNIINNNKNVHLIYIMTLVPCVTFCCSIRVALLRGALKQKFRDKASWQYQAGWPTEQTRTYNVGPGSCPGTERTRLRTLPEYS